MRVLAIMVDVTNMTDEDITELKHAMEAQCEEAIDPDGEAKDAEILSSEVRAIDASIMEVDTDDDIIH